MDKLSVIIIVQNEEQNISDCLESVRWADEIVVVDGGSTDGTLAICKSFTDRIFENPWPGYAAQKQFALDKAQHSWVLSIDADERVSRPLREEIESILSAPVEELNGYRIPRLSTFLNHPILHGGWFPGYQLRLFRKNKTRVSNNRVHEGFLVEGDCGTMVSSILHFTHDSVKASLKRMNDYSSLEALDRYERDPDRHIRWYHMVVHPLSAFVRHFFLKKGYLDGLHGFLLAIVASIVKFSLYAKIWELKKTHHSTGIVSRRDPEDIS